MLILPQPFDHPSANRVILFRFITLEQFVVKFETEILPGYHGMPDAPVGLDKAPEWVLTIESMSPAQRYRALEKARNATPDWQTMGILKRHYYPDCTKIEHYGVRFQNQYYQDDAMKNHVGERVSILSYAISKPYSPSSIGVMLNGKFLCEAFPVRKHDMSGESSAVLQEISDMQRTAKNELTEAVQRISRSADAIMPEDKTLPNPSQKDQLREMAYGQTPEDSPAPSFGFPLQEPSVDAQNETAFAAPSQAPYRGSKASYDKAYDALFGS